MYINLGQTLERFLMDVDVEMNSYATSKIQFSIDKTR